MPGTLFQYVWQYNNQPLDVLAQDILNIISGSGSGPVNTANYIPVSNGLTFQDSQLYYDGNILKTTFTPLPGDTIWGFEFDETTKISLVGDHSAGIQIDSLNGYVTIVSVDSNGPGGNMTNLEFNANDQKIFTDFGVNGHYGYSLDFNNEEYIFGDYATFGIAPKLKIDTANNIAGITLNGNGLNDFQIGVDVDAVIIDADESLTSAGAAGKYITIKVNGVLYKLQLYNL
jgi:hypothetical protein